MEQIRLNAGQITWDACMDAIEQANDAAAHSAWEVQQRKLTQPDSIGIDLLNVGSLDEIKAGFALRRRALSTELGKVSREALEDINNIQTRIALSALRLAESLDVSERADAVACGIEFRPSVKLKTMLKIGHDLAKPSGVVVAPPTSMLAGVWRGEVK